jgi:hypothetical protein
MKNLPIPNTVLKTSNYASKTAHNNIFYSRTYGLFVRGFAPNLLTMAAQANKIVCIPRKLAIQNKSKICFINKDYALTNGRLESFNRQL